MQLPLQIFEDEQNHRIRTVNLDDEIWFYAQDVCDALEIKNPRDALSRMDDDERRTVGSADTSILASRTNPPLINESGLFNLIFQSRKDEAKRFRKWVTSEVLPQLRKSGRYSLTGRGIPNFVRRFNDNWDRTESGYFSVISELFIRLYGRLEHLGYLLPEKSVLGKEIRPDVAVGIRYSRWLKDNHPRLVSLRKTYSHLLPDGMEVEAFQYPIAECLPGYIEFVDRIWIVQFADEYFRERDPRALEYLPKLLPPPDPKAQETAIGKSKFHQMQEIVRAIPY